MMLMSVMAILVAISNGPTVIGVDRLTPEAKAIVTHVLETVPSSWYPDLRFITVDGAAIPADMVGDTCYLPNGDIFYSGPCRINITAPVGDWEYPFPSDGPQVAVRQLTAVVLHELGHQLQTTVPFDPVHPRRTWHDSLIAEAGCTPQHYLRSMLPSCYFTDYKAEFLASMMNQWLTCSRCVLQLALMRWDASNSHPLNQAIFLLAMTGFRPTFPHDGGQRMVLAFDTASDGLPMPEVWTVRPWACGGPITVTGPGFALDVTLDAECRVSAVTRQAGL